MKNPNSFRRSQGFTLIELLVVITIVAVLAAMSFAGVNSALKKAKITQGRVAATNVAQAVNQFYSEYSRLPELTGDLQTDSGGGVELLRILLAEEGSGSDVENSRGINFLSVQEGKGKRGGLYYGSGSGSSVQGLYDPFGNPYQIVMNTDYADVLTATFDGPEGGTRSVELRGEQVAVFSPGPDEKAGTPDDITSFQK